MVKMIKFTFCIYDHNTKLILRVLFLSVLLAHVQREVVTVNAWAPLAEQFCRLFNDASLIWCFK